MGGCLGDSDAGAGGHVKGSPRVKGLPAPHASRRSGYRGQHRTHLAGALASTSEPARTAEITVLAA